MAYSNRYRVPIRRSSRRQTAWDDTSFANFPALSASGVGVAAVGFVLANEAKATIIRIRGQLSLELSATTAVFEGYYGAVGICLVSTPAFTAGVSSLPTPITEPSYPWLWMQHFDLRSATATLFGSIRDTMRQNIDCKAMRKWDTDQTLCAVVEATEAGASTLQGRIGSRTLIKLS